MRRLFILTIAISCFALMNTAQALDFTVDDFDPADPEQAEAYQVAVDELMAELTIIATDDEGVELFQVVPFPLEFIALITQWQIHALDITDHNELTELMEELNNSKPTINSFPFILEGDPDWVVKNVSMYYFPNLEETGGTQIPVIWFGDGDRPEDGLSLATWAMMAESEEQLDDFLEAPKVILVIGEEEDIKLECGFWRQWGLFDMRVDEEEEDATSPSVSE